MNDPRGQQGAATLVLVAFVMVAFVMAISIANWVGTRRRGDAQARIAIKEHYLAQNAIQETRLAMSRGAIGPCVRDVPQLFTYFTVDGSTVSIRVECNPFP